MNTQRIEQVLSLTASGWRPYNGSMARDIYESLHCPHAADTEGLSMQATNTSSASVRQHVRTDAPSGSGLPCWFSRRNIFLCLGCERACSLSRPHGVQRSLSRHSAQGDYDLSPQELVKKKTLLRVDEAAYCLNVSERKVYDWVSFGRLTALKDKPLRIRSEDVAAMMCDFDE